MVKKDYRGKSSMQPIILFAYICLQIRALVYIYRSQTMSWLFGLNKQGTIGDAPQVPVLDDGSGSDGGDKESNTVTPVGSDGDTGYRSEAYSFDSSALERAAKAAKVRSVFYLNHASCHLNYKKTCTLGYNRNLLHLIRI